MYSKFFQTEKTTGQARLLTLYYYPQALELKHGYMAVGGNMGQVELYCYACSGEPIRFKLPARNHTMTTAVHISRIRPLSNYASNRDYVHVMTCSMNEYGVRFFVLPTHSPGSCYRNSQIETCQLLQYGAVAINDAKISPDGRWMVCACDGPVVFLHSVTFNDQGLPEINAARKLQIPLDLIGEGGEYTSQYVAWSRSSEYFAHTSDSHQRVLVWRVATQEILYSIHTGLDTYAIEFNPACDGVLAFISRRGHFQTVNLEEAIDPANPSKVVSILDFDKHVVNRPAHTCSSQCDSQRGHTTNHLAYRTRQLIARQEIVLVPSSDGDSCPEACLPRITGIRWSSDGRHLYIALRSRLLAYRLAALNAVDSLAVIAARHAQDIFEQGAAKSKLTSDGQFHQWLETLENVPDNIRERVTGDTSM
ncbi:hypothetical protein DFQ28_006986 [Apophysomyces sp. BC1034]|nr:hypothetical protein DFQ30_003999 [Apophysomyces sp. BC1015]KAG0182223.1 hypothetical protein DFQ29_005278 [Apophysomyces sp. BC1021]KAG0192954.1 hypothetical protein DFQ28_006986 [Apophysomyces sp. BC1034]